MEVDTGWHPQGVDSCRIIGASWTFVKKTKKFRKKKLTKWSVCRKIICQLEPVYQQFGRNFLESVIYVWGKFSSGLDLAWRHNGSGDYASSWDTTCGMPDASAVPYSSLPSDDDVLWNKLQIFLWTKNVRATHGTAVIWSTWMRCTWSSNENPEESGWVTAAACKPRRRNKANGWCEWKTISLMNRWRGFFPWKAHKNPFNGR